MARAERRAAAAAAAAAATGGDIYCRRSTLKKQ